jgi:hypothetical protein
MHGPLAATHLKECLDLLDQLSLHSSATLPAADH